MQFYDQRLSRSPGNVRKPGYNVAIDFVRSASSRFIGFREEHDAIPFLRARTPQVIKCDRSSDLDDRRMYSTGIDQVVLFHCALGQNYVGMGDLDQVSTVERSMMAYDCRQAALLSKQQWDVRVRIAVVTAQYRFDWFAVEHCEPCVTDCQSVREPAGKIVHKTQPAQRRQLGHGLDPLL